MKLLITTFFATAILSAHAFAQLSSQNNEDFQFLIKAQKENKTVVQLDITDAINAGHPYIDFFQNQDNDYLQWLYVTNKVNMMTNNTSDYYGTRKVLKHSGGNNTLIFKITKTDKITFDTLRNSVHPNYVGEGKEKEKEDWDFLGIRKSIANWRVSNALGKRNIRGELPKGCMTSIETSSRGITIGINVASAISKVKIEIIDKKGTVVSTLVNKDLLRGWTNYQWKIGESSKGTYEVRVRVDDYSLSQDIKI